MKPETDTSGSISPRSFKSVLSTTKVADLPTPKKVIEIQSTWSNEKAFQTLVDNKILSAPVWDVTTKKYTGFLATRDLVSSVVFIAEQKTDEAADKKKSLKDLFVNAKWAEGGFTVTYFSRRNPFKPVTEDSNLLRVCELLATRGPTGVKRIPVVNKEGKVINIISQSTILAFIKIQIQKLEAFSVPIGKLPKIGSSPVLALEGSEAALKAFHLMDSKKLSGLGITKKGRLIGNISGKDLKLFIRHFDMRLLRTPIEDFLKKIRQAELDIRAPTVTCFPKDTLKYVVEKLVATRMHRIFVVDGEEKFKPIRVISLFDVIQYAMTH